MEQNKERKSMDSDVYFQPKETISSQDLIEATITFHEICAYGGTVYKAVMHSEQAITVKKLTWNREGSNIDNRKEPVMYFAEFVVYEVMVILSNYCLDFAFILGFNKASSV